MQFKRQCWEKLAAWSAPGVLMHPSMQVAGLSSPGSPGGFVAQARGPKGVVPALHSASEVDAGRPTNSDLPIFVENKGLLLPDAVNCVSGIRPLYLGVDTADFSFLATEEEVKGSAALLEKLLGQGEIDDDGKRFVVSRVGGFVHRFKLAIADGVEIKFPAAERWVMPVHIHVGARLCLATENIEELVIAELGDWFALSREEVRKRLRLSRVDAALDVLMTEAQFQRHTKMVSSQSSYVVSRGHHREAYQDNGRFTGFAVGREDVRLRFYDKTVKAQLDGTWEMWSTAYGQGEPFVVPEGYVVARVEWQLRRGFLSQLQTASLPDGVLSLAEFRTVAPGVLRYLGSEWFRFAHAAKGENHKRKLLPLWADIVNLLALSKWSELSREVRRKCQRLVAASVQRLEKMLVGCAASIAAILSKRLEPADTWTPDYKVDVWAITRYIDNLVKRNKDSFRQARDRRYYRLTYGVGV